MKVMDAK